MLRIWFLALVVGVYSDARAASFDCGKATTEIEKRICNSPRLAELDRALDDEYRAALEKFSQYDPEDGDRQRFVADQRRWLKGTRDACRDEDCLAKAYTSRLGQVDPFSDQSVGCEEMRRFPALVFADEYPDLGSGNLSPTEVDYGCTGSLSSLDFLSDLLATAESIRTGSVQPQVCTGSIVHAHWRYYHFSLAWAGISPRGFVRRAAEKERLAAEGKYQGSPKDTLTYFQSWSWLSAHNFQLYKKFFGEFDRALLELTEHYQRTFGLSRGDAQEGARHALMLIVGRAAGSYPSASLEQPSRLAVLSADQRASTKDLRAAISETTDESRGRQVYQALTIALLHDKSREYLAELVTSMGAVREEEWSPSGESVLTFSLSQPELSQALIDNGASVTRANEFGKTALFYAIEANNREAVTLLLKNGADVNHAYKTAKELDPYGHGCGITRTKRTPLMHAAQHSDTAMLKLLIERGARAADRDEQGSDAMRYAEIAKQIENAAYLKALVQR